MIEALLIHAYSSKNRGDGLLVDLAAELIRQSFGESTRVTVLAIDAPSFEGSYEVIQYEPASSSAASAILGIVDIVRSIWLGGPAMYPIRAADLGRPDIIVGVGGGYLRTDGGARSLKTFIGHGLQMRWALSTGVPTYYLPQSVGPLTDVPGRLMQRWAHRLQRLGVRDDRSAELMANMAGMHRRPDMAVFAIARRPDLLSAPRQNLAGNPRLVARALRHTPEQSVAYERKLAHLSDAISDLRPALQSSGRGNDDATFYRRMGWDEQVPFLRDLFEGPDFPSVVISVRLHGALEAIRAGIPAIHLSYERKGFGAYSDLGISEFVHNANTFDPELVIDQVRKLRENPSDYWNRIAERCGAIRDEYEELVADLRNILQRG